MRRIGEVEDHAEVVQGRPEGRDGGLGLQRSLWDSDISMPRAC